MKQISAPIQDNTKVIGDRLNEEDFTKFNTLGDILSKVGINASSFKFFGTRGSKTRGGKSPLIQLWPQSSMRGITNLTTVRNSPGG